MDTEGKIMCGVDSCVKLICLECLYSAQGSVGIRAALYKLHLTTLANGT